MESKYLQVVVKLRIISDLDVIETESNCHEPRYHRNKQEKDPASAGLTKHNQKS
jgi:hypothetical protein